MTSVERARYVRLHQCSPEMYEYFVLRERGAKMGLLNALQRNAQKASAHDCVTFVEQTMARVAAANEDERKLIAEIKQAFNPKSDALFYYSYDHGDKLEQGWMIVSKGTIKRKFGVLELELGQDMR